MAAHSDLRSIASSPTLNPAQAAAVRHETGPALVHAWAKACALSPLLPMVAAAVHEAGGHVVVFGGWVRDRVWEHHRGTPIPSRDIDVVVDGIAPDTLGPILRELTSGLEHNRFGGFRLPGADVALPIDCWHVATTLTWVRRGTCGAVDALPMTAALSTEAIVWRPPQGTRQPSLSDGGCLASLTTGLLQYGDGERHDQRVHLLRAAKTMRQFELCPTGALARDIAQAVSTPTIWAQLHALAHASAPDEALSILGALEHTARRTPTRGPADHASAAQSSRSGRGGSQSRSVTI
jgi:hypothetical protein